MRPHVFSQGFSDMSDQRFGIFVALAFLSACGGCNCDPPLQSTEPCASVPNVQPDMVQACGSTTECGDHYPCTEVKDSDGLMCCVFADRKCVTEADCCPGQTCPADRKKCFDKYLSCETDADCGDKGDRFCEEWTDSYGTSKRCRFKACTDGACPDGQYCFQNECMADLPCGGACESGKACVPAIDRCQDYSNPTDRAAAACPVTCAAGFIATFNDNRNVWDTCRLPEVACVCAELPPLRSEDLGRFSAIAADATQNRLFVSAYDGQYGDLVVLRFDGAGTLAGTEYVDGVPSGTVRFGPSGARGGVVEPGPDVGRYTDVAVHNGQVFVSYYDVTNGDVKLALRSTDGTWRTMRVDGTDADLGLYSSVAVDSDGYPGLSYFQKGGGATFDSASCPAPPPTGDKTFITALKFARANTASPAGPADFTVRTIACQSRPPPPCYNCAQTCADPGTGAGCYAPDTTCTGCDANTEVCVMVGTTPTCAKKYNPSNLAEVVDGVGLFSALAFNGKDAYIAYMNRTGGDGDLYGVRLGAQNTVLPQVLLDAAGDTGFFPDVKLDPGGTNVAVSYHDFSSRAFKLFFAPNFQAGVTPEVIDPGTGAASSGVHHWVGTDSALAFAGAQDLYAVYQDATGGDLKLARRQNNVWTLLSPLRTEGAVGFFADAVMLGSKLFASHARIHAKLVAGEPRVDNSLLLEQYTGP
ncbi:MAG: hypothetical protein ACOZIN_00835 [Myxococcota bacterium]